LDNLGGVGGEINLSAAQMRKVESTQCASGSPYARGARARPLIPA